MTVTSYSNHSSSTSVGEHSLSSQERLELAHWGLPELVRARYAQKGISNMFAWQAECLAVGDVLQGEREIKKKVCTRRDF